MEQAPFKKGDRVVCIMEIGSPNAYAPYMNWRIKKGDTYIVTIVEPHAYMAGLWAIGLVESPDHTDRFAHIQFALVQEQYTDMTASIAESAKQTDEVPDKLLLPETVN